MPIYMDLHMVPGVRAKDAARAHFKDILIQSTHNCNCMTYWIDEARGNVFCLIEAPSESAVVEMHTKAHGLVPHQIIEVKSTLVESFLGRIHDPEELVTLDEGLKVFHDPSFRILLVTDITDPVLLRYKLGAEKANELLNRQNSVIRKELAMQGGREVEHGGNGFIASFSSAAKAVASAVAIQKALSTADVKTSGFKIAVTAGEPVTKNKKLFGDTIQFALRLCTIAGQNQVAIASGVREFINKDHFQNQADELLSISPQDEIMLNSIMDKLEENWQDADFNASDFCQAMAMSISRLYRKTTMLTGLSPNLLLKEFRLEKARELMKKQFNTISEITFDSGFSSPSYFTKCFKKKYGLLPMAYLHLLH